MTRRLTPWQQLAAVVLVAACITLGCSADNVAETLASTSATTPAGTGTTPDGVPAGVLPSLAGLTPLAVNRSGTATGRGTADDVISVNRAAEAVFAALAAGPLEAADGEGGPIDDRELAGSPGSSGRAASAGGVPSPGERIGMDPGLRPGPRSIPLAQSSSFLIPLAIATLQEAAPSTAVAEAAGQGVRLRSLGGINLNLSGVTATHGTTEPGAPIDGLSLGGALRFLGTLGVGQRPEVDLRAAGLSGILGRTGDGLNAIDLTMAAPGVTVQGVILGTRVDFTFTGLHGRFTDVGRLNTRLATEPLRLHIASLTARDALESLRADLVVSDVVLPVRAGDVVRYALSGVVDATLSPRHPLARTGRVAHVNVDVPRNSALMMTGLEGPFDGSAVVVLTSPGGKTRDRLVHAYGGGVLAISGTRTNASGEAERVTSTGDMRRAAGGVRHDDGSRAEHVLDVRRTRIGRRIQFQFITKDARGVQQLVGDAVVHAERGLTGRWARPAPGGADGTFTVTADGEVELIGRDGDLLARATMREGWNDLLF